MTEHRSCDIPGKAVMLLICMLSPVNPMAATGESMDALPDSPTPSPQLAPADVVRIQVEALQNNGPSDDGIALTYRFASPANKRSTGPLSRFTNMVRSSPYDRLLNHRHASYEPLALAGDTAHQRVVITDSIGEEITYHWVLVRQMEGEHKDCWMTDAVIPTAQPAQRILTQYQATEPLPARFVRVKRKEVSDVR